MGPKGRKQQNSKYKTSLPAQNCYSQNKTKLNAQAKLEPAEITAHITKLRPSPNLLREIPTTSVTPTWKIIIITTYST